MKAFHFALSPESLLFFVSRQYDLIFAIHVLTVDRSLPPPHGPPLFQHNIRQNGDLLLALCIAKGQVQASLLSGQRDFDVSGRRLYTVLPSARRSERSFSFTFSTLCFALLFAIFTRLFSICLALFFTFKKIRICYLFVSPYNSLQTERCCERTKCTNGCQYYRHQK